MVPNERSGPLLHVRGLIFDICKKIAFLWPLKVGRFFRNWAVEIVVVDAITFGYALPLIFFIFFQKNNWTSMSLVWED